MRVRRNLHEINALLPSHVKSFASRYHFRTSIAHHSHFTYAYLFIYAVLIFHFVILHSTILCCFLDNRLQSYLFNLNIQNFHPVI
ncbi:hypothetical protein HMPREF1146_0558 [Prevotella sp. MSX73]|nr:hypothetical protein HMPREF1146_0558 [Prevotella sp. MSX73]